MSASPDEPIDTVIVSRSPPEISIVIPCFNEEENVAAIHIAVKTEVERHASSHEIIFIDNFSSDRTRVLLRAICVEDSNTRAIFNNRNYGQMRSPTYGLYQARGRAVIGMCADFQDPPAMIGQLITQWRAGAQVVLGQRRTEEGDGLLRGVRKLGYRMLGIVSDYPVVPGATGFGLFDRLVIDTVSRWNEPEPYFRGMVVESGYRLAVIPFDRPVRAAGETKNNWRTLGAFALSGLTGSARSLLRAPIVLSLFAGGATLLGIMTMIGDALLNHGVRGWLLVLVVQFAIFAVLLLFLGLLGDQVRLIAERTRHTPLVVEEERINFAPEPTKADA